MKRIITLVATIAIVGSPAFAQKRKSTQSSKPAASAPAQEQPTYSYSGGSGTSYSNGPQFSALASLGSVGGGFGIGPSILAEWPVQLDSATLMVGGQVGVLFGDSTIIPILVNGRYTFSSTGSITPYVGMSMGISIAPGSSTTVAGITVTSSSSTAFTFLARGGVNFGSENRFFAELPLGAMSSAFAILPSFGYRF
jgi:hypothetical protein